MDSVSSAPLTPLRFLERAAEVFPDKVGIVHGERRITNREFAAEATRLARALQASGIQPGDRVGYLLPNIPEMLVGHFGVPLAGAVLVAINIRLAPEEIRYICDHSGAKMLVATPEFAENLGEVAGELETVEELVLVGDGGSGDGSGLTQSSYVELLARGNDEPLPWSAADELDTITINYTSGTTGRPKGVEFSHRGAYLNALGEMLHSEQSADSVYLWTLPMFHCNGWCTTWGVTAMGGCHVCLEAVRADAIWELIDSEGITHLNGAPTVLTTIVNADEAHPLDAPLTATTAGAPPSPTVIGQLEELGVRLIHMYGLTETYGPYSVCDWQPDWPELESEPRAKLLARQGVAMLQAEQMRVVDSEMNDVPADGETMGEIVMRGNMVMKGYFNDPDATAKAFEGGWFHSGDLGVMHPDRYVQLLDRAKDVVISGGENISTVEVEQAVLSHDAVLEAAVIGIPDERWGERPKAFVALKPGRDASADELIEHVRSRIAGYKTPDAIDFVEELPKTSTGKVQKFELREREWAGEGARVKG
jgi:fatty-acyl-CoA synthase